MTNPCHSYDYNAVNSFSTILNKMGKCSQYNVKWKNADSTVRKGGKNRVFFKDKVFKMDCAKASSWNNQLDVRLPRASTNFSKVPISHEKTIFILCYRGIQLTSLMPQATLNETEKWSKSLLSHPKIRFMTQASYFNSWVNSTRDSSFAIPLSLPSFWLITSPNFTIPCPPWLTRSLSFFNS